MDTKIIVYGMSSSYSTAQNTVATLKQAGFLDSDLLVLFASSIDSKRFANENHINTTDESEANTYSGAAIGVFIGWLAMAGLGVIASPVVGYFILATPVLGGLIGARIGRAINEVTEVLHKLGMTEDEAKEYECYIKEGEIFILVSTSDEEHAIKAAEVLKVTEVKKIDIKYQTNNVDIEKFTAKKTEAGNQVS